MGEFIAEHAEEAAEALEIEVPQDTKLSPAAPRSVETSAAVVESREAPLPTGAKAKTGPKAKKAQKNDNSKQPAAPLGKNKFAMLLGDSESEEEDEEEH